MSTKNHKAIFERQEPSDEFGELRYTYAEVCSEWISLEPLTGRELFQAQQVQSKTSHKAMATHSQTLATVGTDCRVLVRRTNLVNEDNPEASENFRVFHIERMTNVREQNREFEFLLIEDV